MLCQQPKKNLLNVFVFTSAFEKYCFLTSVREAGRLTADLFLSLQSSKSNLTASFPGLCQTFCYIFSTPIPSGLSISWWNTLFFSHLWTPFATLPSYFHTKRQLPITRKQFTWKPQSPQHLRAISYQGTHGHQTHVMTKCGNGNQVTKTNTHPSQHHMSAPSIIIFPSLLYGKKLRRL